MTSGEDAFTARLRERLSIPASSGIGIGDDAALVRIGNQDVVVATDVIVDGRHFELADCGMNAAVHKAVAINLSDLAAVAAIPDAFLMGAVLPHAQAGQRADELATALERVVAAFDVPCIGGDTNVADGPLTLSVTVVGHPGPQGFVARSGAAVGDTLSVTGALGGSGGGRHLLAVPRMDAAQALAARGIVHAMIDLSDGLSTDLVRLCGASGVGATIDGHAVPVHEDVTARDPRARLAHALNDGEDFELLVAHPALDPATRAVLAAQGVVLHAVGRCTEPDAGIALRLDGTTTPWEARGFDHFTSD